MRIIIAFLLATTLFLAPVTSGADGLTKIIQEDLAALGYDTGEANGELTAATVVAISEFQTANNLEVTGEPSPQLAGVIKAALKNSSGAAPANAAVGSAAPPPQNTMTLQAAQQACLQQKMEAAQKKQKKKRGFKRLASAVARTAGQFGGGSTAAQMAQTTADIYAIDATADDLSAAAKDLGLTEDDIEACRTPS